MRIEIPDPGFRKIPAILSAGGQKSRLVGACVRYTLIGADPKDMDVATIAAPNVLQRPCEPAGLREVPTGLQHGTVMYGGFSQSSRRFPSIAPTTYLP
ncbi:hypothetical protein ACU8NU_26260 (plasmid) [Rhizobium leguminosarum]